MQQRRLRLGDIVDDYCPRERRITNHAVVAMIEDDVKQTRCTTCDADHEYKQARIPAPRRRKDSSAPADAVAGAPRKRQAADAVDSDVVTDAAGGIPVTGTFDPSGVEDLRDAASEESASAESVSEESASEETAANESSAKESAAPPTAAPAPEPGAVPLQASEAAASVSGVTSDQIETADAEGAEPAGVEDDGPVHRRLIRATLPRPEGQVPERKIPEFTMHQRDMNGNRAGRSQRRGPRPGQMRAQQDGPSSRFGGQRQGPRHGSGQGGPQGQAGPPRRRKRRR